MRPDRVAFLAYFVFTAFARQGLAREACTIVIDHLFRAYDAVEIRAEMDFRNVPSRCLVEALGFKRQSHTRQTTLRGRPALDYRYHQAPVALDEVPNECCVRLRPDRRDRRLIRRMINAHAQRRAGLERGDHRRRELEAQEAHGRRFSSVSRSRSSSAIARRAASLDLDEHACLDARSRDSARRRSATSSYSISIVASVRAVGNEWVVGIELAWILLLEDLLDAQHFLDLVAHGELVLER